MADNHMDLRHVPTGDTFRVAEFWNQIGWRTKDETDEEKVDFVDRLNAWLYEHVESQDDLLNGGAIYVLDYKTGSPENAKHQENLLAKR